MAVTTHRTGTGHSSKGFVKRNRQIRAKTPLNLVQFPKNPDLSLFLGQFPPWQNLINFCSPVPIPDPNRAYCTGNPAIAPLNRPRPRRAGRAPFPGF